MRFGSFCSLDTDVKICHLQCDRNSGRRSCCCRYVVLIFQVPVDPMVMASDASLTGGAICRSTASQFVASNKSV